MTHVFDTGEPQGSPPTSTPTESEGGGAGAGLDLDRLARQVMSNSEAIRAAEYIVALEAVAEAATMLEQWVGRRQPQPFSTIDHTFVAYVDSLRAALAAAGGGAHE